MYAYVVVDTSSYLTDVTLAAIDNSDAIVLDYHSGYPGHQERPALPGPAADDGNRP